MGQEIIVALDFPTLKQALPLVERIAPQVGCFKVGLQMMMAEGAPKVVAAVHALGGKVFCDGKFHDIPNTVFGASQAIPPDAVSMFNVHCTGGRKMMEKAREAVEKFRPRPLLLGVTLLTSLGYDDLAEMGMFPKLNIWKPEDLKRCQDERITEFVVNLARLSQDCGLDGVVCSPHEIAAIRRMCGPNFKIIVPGVRPLWASTDDQKRVMTPGEAAKAGANYVVVGRPVTDRLTKPLSEIPTPEAAIRAIDEEIAKAMKAEGGSHG
jgi:orotidine-5'-phosphate decarboxylase